MEKRWNYTVDQKWEDNYLYNGQLSTSRCIKTVIIFQQQFVFNIEINGSVQLFQKIENIIRSSDDSKRQACMRDTHAERSWQAGHGKPWTSTQNLFKTRWTRRIQRKAFPIGGSPSQIIWRTWRRMCPHIPVEERTQIRKVMLQSGDTRMEAQYLYSLPQIPKLRHLLENRNNECSLQKTRWGIYSANRKVWCLDNSRAQHPQRRTWISEQSPIRCCSSRSHHSVDIIHVETKIRRRRRRVYESFLSRRRSQKLLRRKIH